MKRHRPKRKGAWGRRQRALGGQQSGEQHFGFRSEPEAPGRTARLRWGVWAQRGEAGKAGQVSLGQGVSLQV